MEGNVSIFVRIKDFADHFKDINIELFLFLRGLHEVGSVIVVDKVGI